MLVLVALLSSVCKVIHGTKCHTFLQHLIHDLMIQAPGKSLIIFICQKLKVFKNKAYVCVPKAIKAPQRWSERVQINYLSC